MSIGGAFMDYYLQLGESFSDISSQFSHRGIQIQTISRFLAIT